MELSPPYRRPSVLGADRGCALHGETVRIGIGEMSELFSKSLVGKEGVGVFGIGRLCLANANALSGVAIRAIRSSSSSSRAVENRLHGMSGIETSRSTD